jgi:Tfp pilus assembly protein PilF
VSITFCTYLFRNEIKGRLNNLTELRVRCGQTELSSTYEQPDSQSVELDLHQQDSKESIEEASNSGEAESVESKSSNEHLGEMVRAFTEDNDIECGERLFEGLQYAEEDGEQKLRNEAIYLYLRYSAGDISAMDRLLQLLERVKTIPTILPVVHNFIGMAYEESDEFAKASECYECAARTAQTNESRAAYKVSATRSKFLSGDASTAYEEIKEEINKSEAPRVTSLLYVGISNLYHRSGNMELKAISLEKAIECSPNDKDLRFDAAYSYNDAGLVHLSLLHYLKATEFDPDHSSALNNVGIVYGQLGMPVKQIKSYKRASNNKNTLASANMAYQYIEAGFAEEAKILLQEANQEENVHSNVNKALSALADARQSEDDKEKESLEEARIRRQHLLLFAEAYFDSSVSMYVMDSEWKLADGVTVAAEKKGEVFEFGWERKENRYLIRTQIENRSLKVLEYNREHPNSVILADTGYAYISKDEKHIVFMMFKNSKRSDLTLERVQ